MGPAGKQVVAMSSHAHSEESHAIETERDALNIGQLVNRHEAVGPLCAMLDIRLGSGTEPGLVGQVEYNDESSGVSSFHLAELVGRGFDGNNPSLQHPSLRL